MRLAKGGGWAVSSAQQWREARREREVSKKLTITDGTSVQGTRIDAIKKVTMCTLTMKTGERDEGTARKGGRRMVERVGGKRQRLNVPRPGPSRSP